MNPLKDKDFGLCYQPVFSTTYQLVRLKQNFLSGLGNHYLKTHASNDAEMSFRGYSREIL